MSIETELPVLKDAREAAKHALQSQSAAINAEGYTASKEDIDKFYALKDDYEKADAAYEGALKKREDARGREDRQNVLAKIAEHDEKYKSYDYKPRDAGETPEGVATARDRDAAFSAWAMAGAGPEYVTEAEVRAAKRAGISVFSDRITPLPTTRVDMPNGEVLFVADRRAGGGLFAAHERYLEGLNHHVSVLGRSAGSYMAAADATGDSRDPDGYGRLNQLPTVLSTLEQNMITYGGILEHPIRTIVTDDYEDIIQDVFDDTMNEAVQTSEGATIGENKRAALYRITWKYFDYTSNDFELTDRQLARSRYTLPSVIGPALGERLGRKFGKVLTYGNGSSEPDGVRTASLRDVFTTQTAGNKKVKAAASNTVIAVDEIGGKGPEYLLDQMFTVGPGVGFSMHRTTLGYLETLKDLQGRPFFGLGIETASNRRTLRNYPIYFNYALDAADGTTNITGKYPIGFGDWSKYEVRRAGGGVPTLIRDSTSKRRQLITIFTALMSIDGRLRNLGNMPIAWLKMA